MTRTCLDCSGTISTRNQSGRCRRCVMLHMQADAAVAARRLAKLKSPETRAKKSAAARRAVAEGRNNPAWVEKKRASGVGLQKLLHGSPEARARWLSARARRLDWCPADRMEEYRALRKKIGAGEAKRLILADVAAKIAATEARRVDALTPLQRQLERLHAGAALIERPSFRRADHAFTLGGIASGLL